MNEVDIPRTIDGLVSMMLARPQVPCDVTHAFSPGIYIRQVTLRAGTFAIGHRQKTEHLNVVLTGRVTMFHDNGTREEVIAPAVCVGKPGRKVGYVHEDVIWLNIYPTTETDIAKLEAMYLDKAPEWDSVEGSIDRSEDREDFARMLDEMHTTKELVRCQSEDTTDQMPFPFGAYKCRVGHSHIEGQGLIASADLEQGEVIAPARVDGKRTPAGRYTNHSANPNAAMCTDGQDIYLVAVRRIGGNLGGHDGEEITVDYRQALKLNESLKQ